MREKVLRIIRKGNSEGLVVENQGFFRIKYALVLREEGFVHRRQLEGTPDISSLRFGDKGLEVIVKTGNGERRYTITYDLVLK